MAARCFDGVGRDDAMEERDGADAVLGGAGAERLQLRRFEGWCDGRCLNVGREAVGALYESVIERVEGGPGLSGVAAG